MLQKFQVIESTTFFSRLEKQMWKPLRTRTSSTERILTLLSRFLRTDEFLINFIFIKKDHKESVQCSIMLLAIPVSALETKISANILIRLRQNVCFIYLIIAFWFSLKVASFNIQVFGQTKYGKEPVKNQIVEILQRYDISTIQVWKSSIDFRFIKFSGNSRLDWKCLSKSRRRHQRCWRQVWLVHWRAARNDFEQRTNRFHVGSQYVLQSKSQT